MPEFDHRIYPTDEEIKESERRRLARYRAARELGYAKFIQGLPESNQDRYVRIRNYLMGKGIDIANDSVNYNLGFDFGGHYINEKLRARADDALYELFNGERDYIRSPYLGRANEMADATFVAKPTLDQLARKGLYQDKKMFSGF